MAEPEPKPSSFDAELEALGKVTRALEPLSPRERAAALLTVIVALDLDWPEERLIAMLRQARGDRTPGGAPRARGKR